MSVNEIITIQFGNFSNHVGTHYWNSHYKRMLDHDRKPEEDRNYVSKLFRESQNVRSRFVPRAMCFDIKTKLQSLKQTGTFDKSNGCTDDVEMTDENIVTYSESTINKNDFLKDVMAGEVDAGKKVNFDFEQEVKTWSDYMMYEFDDHSIHLLNDTYNDGDEFAYFGLGQNEYEALEDVIEDNLHFWSEECDHMEGFQLIGDLHNGYCGLQAKVLEYIADEFNKKAKLNFHNWALSKKDVDDKDMAYQCLNTALTMQSMKEYSSLSVLQSLDTNIFSKERSNVKIPHLQYNNDLVYHTSAVLASAIDSSTIPLYQVNTPLHLSELCFHSSLGKWKLAGTSFGVPLHGLTIDSTLFELFLSSEGLYGDLVTSLFPVVQQDVVLTPTSQLVVLQNLPSNQVCPGNIDSKILQRLELNCNVFNNNPHSVLEYFTERFYPCEQTITKFHYSFDKLRTSPPFPAILKEIAQEDNINKPNNVTTMASIFTAPSFFNLISEVVFGIKKMNLNKFHIVQEFGLDRDLMNELIEDLIGLARIYNHDRAFHELEE